MSARAAINLNKQGYKKAYAIIGGLDEMPKYGFTLIREGKKIYK